MELEEPGASDFARSTLATPTILVGPAGQETGQAMKVSLRPIMIDCRSPVDFAAMSGQRSRIAINTKYQNEVKIFREMW